MDKLVEAARIAVRDCMALKADELALVVTDVEKRNIGEAVWEAAKELGSDAVLIEMVPRDVNGEEPPITVGEAMKAADVVLAPTAKSITHTESRRNACATGTRVATLPGITEGSMARTLFADYSAIAERSRRLADILTEGSECYVTTPAGTDLRMSISAREGKADTGMIHRRGDYGNLPAGEGFIAPVEGSAEGILVIDGSMAGLGMLNGFIKIEVKGGLAAKLADGNEADILRGLLEEAGSDAGNIAELGIGTNDRAIVTGLVLEDEKVMGTVHIALGDNASMGGSVKVPLHLDGVLIDPTLLIDGSKVMENGVLLI
jgi:leucyl aminopeptidase (aminopeptidase T)